MPPPRVAPASPFTEFIGPEDADVFGHVGELCASRPIVLRRHTL